MEIFNFVLNNNTREAKLAALKKVSEIATQSHENSDVQRLLRGRCSIFAGLVSTVANAVSDRKFDGGGGGGMLYESF